MNRRLGVAKGHVTVFMRNAKWKERERLVKYSVE